MLWAFGLDFGMLTKTEYRICQRLPVIARANDFYIAADFPFVAEQQGDIITAVAEIEPQRRVSRKGRFSLLAIDDVW